MLLYKITFKNNGLENGVGFFKFNLCSACDHVHEKLPSSGEKIHGKIAPHTVAKGGSPAYIQDDSVFVLEKVNAGIIGEMFCIELTIHHFQDTILTDLGKHGACHGNTRFFMPTVFHEYKQPPAYINPKMLVLKVLVFATVFMVSAGSGLLLYGAYGFIAFSKMCFFTAFVCAVLGFKFISYELRQTNVNPFKNDKSKVVPENVDPDEDTFPLFHWEAWAVGGAYWLILIAVLVLVGWCLWRSFV
jgi:hypothetical protein